MKILIFPTSWIRRNQRTSQKGSAVCKLSQKAPKHEATLLSCTIKKVPDLTTNSTMRKQTQCLPTFLHPPWIPSTCTRTQCLHRQLHSRTQPCCGTIAPPPRTNSLSF